MLTEPPAFLPEAKVILPNIYWRFIYSIGQRIVWIVTFLVTRLGTRFSIQNKERLKNLPRPLLIVANHRSYWDSMIVGTLFPFFSNRFLPLGFIAADGLFKKPIFKVFFALTGTFPTYRGKGYGLSLQYPRYVLKNNGGFLIFPFGKILLDENTVPIPRRGIGILAAEFSNLTILPIYLNTTPNINLISFLFERKEMGVIVGKPFQLSEEMRAWSVEKLALFLAKKIYELR